MHINCRLSDHYFSKHHLVKSRIFEFSKPHFWLFSLINKSPPGKLPYNLKSNPAGCFLLYNSVVFSLHPSYEYFRSSGVQGFLHFFTFSFAFTFSVPFSPFFPKYAVIVVVPFPLIVITPVSGLTSATAGFELSQ